MKTDSHPSIEASLTKSAGCHLRIHPATSFDVPSIPTPTVDVGPSTDRGVLWSWSGREWRRGAECGDEVRGEEGEEGEEGKKGKTLENNGDVEERLGRASCRPRQGASLPRSLQLDASARCRRTGRWMPACMSRVGTIGAGLEAQRTADLRLVSG